MLTVKVYDASGVRAGYCCDSYTLIPPGAALRDDCATEDVPRVVLMDDDGHVRTVIRPAPTSTIYVMNAGGRTIDTMRFDKYGGVTTGQPVAA